MVEPSVKKTGNVCIYDEEFVVDLFDWGMLHPKTDFVYSDCDDDNMVTIYAYAPVGNISELQTFIGERTGLKVHGHVPTNLLGRIGYAH